MKGLITICAWCGLVMREGDAGAEVSHGICVLCAEKFEAGVVPRKEAA
jgi:hypothetical protein